MPPSPREKGRVSRPRGSEEEFVLFLQGIPARCRWQELKDLVRQTALHIRQAVVYDDHHGFPTGLGQIIVKNEDEAWRTYHRLSTNGWEGQSLVVTLARTSSPTRPIAGPTKSPSCVIPTSYVAGYTTPPRVAQNMAIPPSPISPEPVISTSPTYHGHEYGPIMNPMAIPHQPFMPIFTDPLSQPISGMPNSPALRPSFCDPMAFGVLPTYPMPHIHPSFPDAHMTHAIRVNPRRASSNHSNNNSNMSRKSLYNHPNSSGLPSYPDSPSRQPSRRTIFIQNLSPQTTSKDLQTFLQESGTVEQCEVPVDPETTRCKGFARVTFRSIEEAKHAVALYNSAIFMGAKIRVKIDRSIHTASYSLSHSSSVSCDSRSASSSGSETNQVQPPTPSTARSRSSDSEKNIASEDPPVSKPIDRCQPLVVNGSGIGKTVALST